MMMLASRHADAEFPFCSLAAQGAPVRFQNAAQFLVAMQPQVDRPRALDGKTHHFLRLVERALAPCAGRQTPPKFRNRHLLTGLCRGHKVPSNSGIPTLL